MTFQRITNRAPITLYTLLGLLILASQIFAIAWLIIAGDWSVFWSLGIGLGLYSLGAALLCLMFGTGAVMISAFAAAGLIGQARRIRAIADDVYATELARLQPDPTLALQPGESLRVAWRVSSGTTARRVISSILLIPLMGAFGAVAIFMALPGFRFSALNPFDSIFPLAAGQSYSTPSVFDWIALICPFLWIAGLSVVQLAQQRSLRRNALIADDRGITLKRGFSRRFMAWNDITAFVRLSPPDNTPIGGYFLGGKTRSFLISIARATVESIQLNNRQIVRAVASARVAVQFEGSVAGYEVSARRLLATIVARGHTPLYTFKRLPPLVSWLQRRFPQRALRIRDAANAPLAGARWQPAAVEIALLPPAGLRVILQARPGFGRIVRTLTLWMIGLLTLTVVATVGSLTQAPPLDLFSSGIAVCGWYIASNTLTEFIMGSGIFLLFSPIAIVGAISSQRNRIPTVLADDIGVTRKTPGNASVVTILWAEIRVWGVIPPTHTHRGNARVTYLLFTESGKLIWVEPADARLAGRDGPADRRAAYREQAERLHALIVERTGLPLRDLTQSKA